MYVPPQRRVLLLGERFNYSYLHGTFRFQQSSNHNNNIHPPPHPSLLPPPLLRLFSHRQQYVKNVLQRAGDEVRNLRADYRLRESLDVFNRCTTKHHTTATASTPTTTSNKISVKLKFALRSISHNLGVRTRTHTRSGGTGSSHGGIVGLVSDLVDVPDPLVARALSNKRRAALSTVVVDNDDVLFELRRRNLIGGPVNFLPLSTLHLENTSLLPRILSASTMPPPSAAPPTAARTRGQGARERGTVNGGGVGGHEAGGSVERFDLLPVAPESPAPPGFVGYAVRLLQLRSEHESLRWTVLFTLFKDLAVFETTEQVTTRSHGQKRKSADAYAQQ